MTEAMLAIPLGIMAFGIVGRFIMRAEVRRLQRQEADDARRFHPAYKTSAD